MNRVFSGGCVYEFWQGSNGYGLVEMLNRETGTKMKAYQQDPDDEKKVIEKRETDQGLLLIYQDFAKYKAKLVAARCVETNWDRGDRNYEGDGGGNVDMMQMSWPWEPECQEPESCINWGKIEELVRSGI